MVARQWRMEIEMERIRGTKGGGGDHKLVNVNARDINDQRENLIVSQMEGCSYSRRQSNLTMYDY